MCRVVTKDQELPMTPLSFFSLVQINYCFTNRITSVFRFSLNVFIHLIEKDIPHVVSLMVWVAVDDYHYHYRTIYCIIINTINVSYKNSLIQTDDDTWTRLDIPHQN